MLHHAFFTMLAMAAVALLGSIVGYFLGELLCRLLTRPSR